MKIKIIFFLYLYNLQMFPQTKKLESQARTLDTLILNNNILGQIETYKEIVKYVHVKGLYYFKIFSCYSEINDTINSKNYIIKTLEVSPEYIKVIENHNFFTHMTQIDKNEIVATYNISMSKHKRQLIKNDTLSLFLKKLIQKDQYYRSQITQYMHLSKENYSLFKFKFDSLMIKQKVFDSLNQTSLDSIVKINGWPDLKIVDSDAMNNAYYIAQHCINIKKRKKYLKHIKNSAYKNNGSYKLYASYIDRTLMLKEKKQLFGVEQIIKNSEGAKLHPIKDIKNLNNRRIKFGLGLIKI